MKDKLEIIVEIAAIVIIAGMVWFGLTGCQTKYVAVPEYHQVYVEKHDTLHTRDSIFQKDSVYMWMHGDTIWKEKYTIKYKDRWRDKIVYRDSIKVDSVRVPYPVEKHLTSWQKRWIGLGKFFSGGFIAFVIIFVIRLWLRVRSKI